MGKPKKKPLPAYFKKSLGLQIRQKQAARRKAALEAKKADTTKTTAKPSSTSRKTSTDDTDSTTRTKKMDSDHTITVSAPEGAEVYLDNVYKGLAPCTFTKVIGSQTITLRKDGYTTKSYSVDVLDDDQDVKFSFSDLGVKEETAETTATPAP